jgi:hypothetical protein
MFGTIRKHQTWLWFIIIAVMILSMATFTQMNRSGNQRGGPGGHGEIDGKPITDSEFQNAWNETALMYFLRTREFPETSGTRNGWNQEQQTYQRLFLIRKLEQYNIRPDADSVAQLASLFLRELGKGETIPLSEFEKQILIPHRMTSDDFQRFMEHYVAIQQLVSVVGSSGTLVPPAEIESLYIQAHQEVKAQAVVFSASNYLATIPEPTAALLGQFFTNEQARYREPDRLQVNYVRFNITNYLADAEKAFGPNISNQVAEVFRQLGTNAFSLGKTEADQKTKIHDILIRGSALSNAYTAALSFQRDLNSKDPVRADNLNALAKERSLEVKITKPFDKEYGPSDFTLPQNVPASSLFDLTAADPFFSTPIKAEDGAYILAFDKLIPSRIPPLEEIRSRVIADCKEFEAMRTAQMSARMFEQTATNGLAKGQTFAEITRSAKVKPLDLPPFSLSTESLPEIEDEVDFNTFKQNVVETPTGKVSGLIPTHSGGMVVYVGERLPVDKAKMQAELPAFSKLVRQARQNQAFDMWFQKEFSTVARNLPAFQQLGRS